MNLKKTLFVTTLLALATFGVAQAQMTHQMEPAKAVPNGNAMILVDSGGMTLYTFNNDSNGKSNCYAMCAQNWPPVVGNAASQPIGNFTIITRDDGSKQWAYNGKPLYYWHNDQSPGDKTGNNVGGIWHIVTVTP
jgi:predicted lipoprotein with Yx(FWY)xxD motif